MTTAVVVGVIIGAIFIGMVLLASSTWAARRRRAGLHVQGAVSVFAMLGVVGQRVVAHRTGNDSWWLFLVQLGAALATFAVIALPLRSRILARG